MIATQAATTQSAGQQPQIRDSRWLTLEVCREFQRGTCSRPDTECKFAHPSEKVQVENGRVTACFDSLKGRCTRENCKYLHPPQHLKTQLEINGRNNLVNQRMMQQMSQFSPILQPQIQALPGIPACVNINNIPGTQFSPYLTSAPNPNLAVFPEMFATHMAATPTQFIPHIQQKINRTDRLENFQGLVPCPKRAATGIDKALIAMNPQSYQQAMANMQLQQQMLPTQFYNSRQHTGMPRFQIG